jgi:hypothetical protein
MTLETNTFDTLLGIFAELFKQGRSSMHLWNTSVVENLSHKFNGPNLECPSTQDPELSTELEEQ